MGVKLSTPWRKYALFTTSASKVEDGRRLGADLVILSKSAAQMAEHAQSFDLIIDTSPQRTTSPLFRLVEARRAMVQVGAPEHPLSIAVFL